MLIIKFSEINKKQNYSVDSVNEMNFFELNSNFN